MRKFSRNDWMAFVVAAATIAGCGAGPGEAGSLTQLQDTDNGLSSNGLSWNGLSDNGLSWNGLSWNGLSGNGLSWNGLSWNGLSWNGLSTSEFSAWFTGQSGGVAYTDMVMRYIVKCAAPAGTSLGATIGGVSYTWDGELGLAPQWTAGSAIPVAEQQLITACLGAHANKFGLRLSISLTGYKSDGSPIVATKDETKSYAVREGCFFGNMFSGEGVFAGNDSVLPLNKSSTRACALSIGNQPNNSCPPMAYAGACAQRCQTRGDKNVYASCTYGGTSYPAITTRISDDIVYKCGDGICQASESCGTGTTANNCADCGPCT